MGKNKDKNREEAPNPTNVTNRDILQRLNFLYQASVLLNGLAPSDTTDRDIGVVKETFSPHSRKKMKKRRVVRFEELSRSYIETMKSVGQKTNVRMDPSVKRCICKRCSAPLVPGISATVRVKDSGSHGHLISYQCHCCQAERHIPAPPVAPTESLTNGYPTETSEDSAHPTKKRGPRARVPPHFARTDRHVVFRGTEMLDTTHWVS